MRAFKLFRLVPLLAFAVLLSGSLKAAETNEVKVLAAGNNAFGLNLYNELRTNQGNLFFSPFSISACLAMTATGARGDTEAQMNSMLFFGTNRSQLAAGFGALQRELSDAQTNQQIELNIANALWAQTNHSFLPEFLGFAQKDFQATLKQADFGTPDPVRKEINDWVAAQTKDKITDLMPPGAISGAARLALVNAIYFKGPWGRPFDKARTTNAPFTISAKEKVDVPMMNRTAQFKYSGVKSLQILELPYGDGHLSMVILLPADGAMRPFEGVLTAQSLEFWINPMRLQRVNVSLPRFKLTGRLNLAEILPHMGMTDAFTPKADFSGMDGTHDLFISAVVHKAYVDVNEEGTEAAAASGAVMALKAMPAGQIPVFRADHPFVFVIRDTRSGSILFLGRVVNPAN